MASNNGLRLISGAINISKNELNLKPCLKGGMSFRWQLIKENLDDSVEFVGVIRNKIIILNQISLKNKVEYSVYLNENDHSSEKLIHDELIDYFRLNENLKDLYKEWSERDSKFKDKINQYSDILSGIRSLRLDPVENLFSFICSSNNNIKRITQMVNNMCIHFGNLIGQLDQVDYYSFPSVERLAEKDVEEKLRKLNFGYRAKFIYQAASYLVKNHSNNCENWLYSLREQDYEFVHKELVKIPGIGNKVADCIALMSLDKLEAIPVDTHVLSIATNTYKFNPISGKANSALGTTNLTDKNYKIIADKFRELWGTKAGWAQTIMFIDDLKSFKKETSNSPVKNDSIDKKIKNEKIEIEIKNETKTPIKSNKRAISNTINQPNDKLIFSSKKKKSKKSI